MTMHRSLGRLLHVALIAAVTLSLLPLGGWTSPPSPLSVDGQGAGG